MSLRTLLLVLGLGTAAPAQDLALWSFPVSPLDTGDEGHMAVGDLDGDGRGDVLVGSAFPGEVAVYRGKNGKLLRTLSEAGAVDFGRAVDFAGDVDGDGKGDLLVGAATNVECVPGDTQGRLLVLRGKNGDVLLDIQGPDVGRRLAGVGDLDGDGIPDIASGARRFPCEVVNMGRGRVTVFSGGDGAPIWFAEGDDFNDRLGSSLAPAGDVDGDGTPDVISGAPRASGPSGPLSGQARILSGADGATLLTVFGNGFDTQLGEILDGTGDLNLDGVNDLIVYTTESGFFGVPGIVYARSGADGSLLWTAQSQTETAPTDSVGQPQPFGTIVDCSRAGDVNGDGVPDVVIGTLDATVSGYRVVSGANGFLLRRGSSNFGSSGTSVAAGGDVNDDGYADILFAGRRAIAGTPNESVDVVFGGEPWHILPGVRITDALGTADADLARFPAPEGARFTAVVRTTKGSTVAPRLTLRQDGVGSPVVEGDDSIVNERRARISLALPATDGYQLIVDSQSGTAGDYKLRTRIAFPKPKGTVVVPDEEDGAEEPTTFLPGQTVLGTVTENDVVLQFRAVAGTRLTLSARPGKGSELSPTLRLIGPLPESDELLAVSESVASAKLARAKKLELPALGTYELHVGGQGASTGAFKLKTRVKVPKGKGAIVRPKPARDGVPSDF